MAAGASQGLLPPAAAGLADIRDIAVSDPVPVDGGPLRKAREARLAAEALSQSLCEQNRRTEEEARYDP